MLISVFVLIFLINVLQVEDELMEQYLMDEAYQAMLAEDGGRYVYDIYCCDQSVTGPPGCYALKARFCCPCFVTFLGVNLPGCFCARDYECTF